MFQQIFTPGWEVNLLLYGAVFYLARYIVYRIIYPAIVGTPKYYDFESIRQWYRKASMWSAVVFAPLFEEIWFTFLAFAAFLRYARDGQEGTVMVMVAAFFALLHFPRDWEELGARLSPQRAILLFKYQLDRFFYALAAYIIFESTGNLWITITIHYFFNYVVTICIFEREDHPETIGRQDGRLFLLGLMDLSFAAMSTVYFYQHFPALWPTLLLLTALLFAHFLWVSHRLRKYRERWQEG